MFLLINKWHSWVQYDFTCNPTLRAIHLYMQSNFTCNPTLHAIWLYVQSNFTCNPTLRAIRLYMQSDFTCNPTLRAIQLYVQSGSNKICLWHRLQRLVLPERWESLDDSILKIISSGKTILKPRNRSNLFRFAQSGSLSFVQKIFSWN